LDDPEEHPGSADLSSDRRGDYAQRRRSVQPAEPMCTYVATGVFTATTPAEFLAECRSRGISYVVWDSDNGTMGPDNFYYQRYRINLIAPLRAGRSANGFQLVDSVGIGPSRAYIYRCSNGEK
jgi:hypothetical protein